MVCPKLHFVPFSTIVVIKYLHKFNNGRNKRKYFIRCKNIFLQKPLFRYTKIFRQIENVIYRDRKTREDRKTTTVEKKKIQTEKFFQPPRDENKMYERSGNISLDDSLSM